MRLLELIANSYNNHENSTCLWSSDPRFVKYKARQPSWELFSCWTWDNWLAGPGYDQEYSREWDYQEKRIVERARLSFHLHLGPYSLTLQREWISKEHVDD
jgi:hypothetical protein